MSQTSAKQSDISAPADVRNVVINPLGSNSNRTVSTDMFDVDNTSELIHIRVRTPGWIIASISVVVVRLNGLASDAPLDAVLRIGGSRQLIRLGATREPTTVHLSMPVTSGDTIDSDMKDIIGFAPVVDLELYKPFGYDFQIVAHFVLPDEVVSIAAPNSRKQDFNSVPAKRVTTVNYTIGTEVEFQQELPFTKGLSRLGHRMRIEGSALGPSSQMIHVGRPDDGDGPDLPGLAFNLTKVILTSASSEVDAYVDLLFITDKLSVHDASAAASTAPSDLREYVVSPVSVLIPAGGVVEIDPLMLGSITTFEADEPIDQRLISAGPPCTLR